MSASKVSAQQRRTADRERIEQAVTELASSEGWERWIQTRSAFHNYSFGNTLLIAFQRPDATRVAGFKAWQKLDRQVRKGEKGIRILAPVTVKEKDANGEPTDKVLTFFKSVAVFDVSQTDGEPLPELPTVPIEGNELADRLPMLEQFAGSIGFSVSYEPLSDAGGYCDPQGKRIVVDSGKCGNARVRVLVHELAHALGVGYKDYGREAAECVVETATVIVCASLGLDTSGESVSYIAGWSDGDTKVLRQYAETIDTIAGKLEAACGIREAV